MEISQHIKTEAMELLSKPGFKDQLPIQLQTAPSFFLAEPSDKTVIAFESISYEGQSYKIGTLVQNS